MLKGIDFCTTDSRGLPASAAAPVESPPALTAASSRQQKGYGLFPVAIPSICGPNAEPGPADWQWRRAFIWLYAHLRPTGEKQ